MKKISLAVLVTFVFLLSTSSAVKAANPISTRSNELRAKACQAKEGAVKTRMNNLLRMTNNMMSVFGNITARVEEFYQAKVIPSGKIVSNYDTLVQAVQNKKDAAQTALDKASLDSQQFSCENDNPKSSLVTFRKDMLAVKSALKEYRTAVKNLIVAVHSVTATMEKEKLSGTPKPTKAK